jgi:hypothetical protein
MKRLWPKPTTAPRPLAARADRATCDFLYAAPWRVATRAGARVLVVLLLACLLATTLFTTLAPLAAGASGASPLQADTATVTLPTPSSDTGGGLT